ncbi:putative transcriptional regulator [Halanaeroarchaeum sp. HSR-CO]|uniref:winged helix-turn-helix transcriptional regulator n=1 Tax=Halanaeroarchaeum sp. HSR-CO TaxID=2866382 RepID=UPI00217E7623|nr:ArsR family transcriptional regulator [Halanaeroarchaeum sp. HSR-CO]UWG48231.1 putative transcriptional regulator [Halanaeroarchaeum sp. HSR-CO]
MAETRARIAEAVRTQPGIHFNGLVRSLDLATGQVQYHLKQLDSTDEVVKTELYGRTHYFPDTYDDWERRTLALLRRETTRDVVAALLESGPVRPNALAEELDLARSTLEWHLDHLVEQAVVNKRHSARNQVTVELARPADTIELVRNADPTLLGMMVSRFTRLVDRMLAEENQS